MNKIQASGKGIDSQPPKFGRKNCGARRGMQCVDKTLPWKAGRSSISNFSQSTDALLAQDEDGCTPLHYIVSLSKRMALQACTRFDIFLTMEVTMREGHRYRGQASMSPLEVAVASLKTAQENVAEAERQVGFLLCDYSPEKEALHFSKAAVNLLREMKNRQNF